MAQAVKVADVVLHELFFSASRVTLRKEEEKFAAFVPGQHRD